jgi:hypothetical protein
VRRCLRSAGRSVSTPRPAPVGKTPRGEQSPPPFPSYRVDTWDLPFDRMRTNLNSFYILLICRHLTNLSLVAETEPSELPVVLPTEVLLTAQQAGRQVKLAWQAPEGAAVSHVERSEDGQDWQPLLTSPIIALTAWQEGTDQAPQPGANDYRARGGGAALPLWRFPSGGMLLRRALRSKKKSSPFWENDLRQVRTRRWGFVPMERVFVGKNLDFSLPTSAGISEKPRNLCMGNVVYVRILV